MNRLFWGEATTKLLLRTQSKRPCMAPSIIKNCPLLGGGRLDCSWYLVEIQVPPPPGLEGPAGRNFSGDWHEPRNSFFFYNSPPNSQKNAPFLGQNLPKDLKPFFPQLGGPYPPPGLGGSSWSIFFYCLAKNGWPVDPPGCLSNGLVAMPLSRRPAHGLQDPPRALG